MKKYTVRAIAPCLYHIEDTQGRVVATTQCPDMADTIDYALNYDEKPLESALTEIMILADTTGSKDDLQDALLEIAAAANYALMEV